MDALPLSVLVSLAISGLVPYLLERLKGRPWVPIVQPYAPALNRTTAIAVSVLTALGVTVDYDATVGVLTVTGLLPEQLLRSGLQAAANFVLQESIYRTRIDPGGPRR